MFYNKMSGLFRESDGHSTGQEIFFHIQNRKFVTVLLTIRHLITFWDRGS